MKVLITTDWYKPVINGVVTSVISLLDGLTALGADVRILTLSKDLHSYKEGNVTYIGSIGVGKIYPNARLKAVPSSKYIQDLIEWHPDIVHSQCEFSTFFLAKKIAEACACPLVHTYHTVYEEFTHYFSPSIWFGRYMAAAFSKRILAKTDFVIAPTGKVRDLLQRYGVKTPVEVIPSGLELEQFAVQMDDMERNTLREKLGIGKEDVVLLYLGRLAQEKNIEELLLLTDRYADPHIKLLLVGDGPYRSVLEEKAAKLRLGERVIFAGMVPLNEVARYYSLGDIFVSASQSETQGLTYVEAMAAGLPLLCRDDPCLLEVVQNGKNGLTYINEDEFRQKLGFLLHDKYARYVLGNAEKKTVFQQFSAIGFAGNVLKNYQALLMCGGTRSVDMAGTTVGQLQSVSDGAVLFER